MNELEKLSSAWYWAQENVGISPEFVSQHIDNMRDALNKGRVIIPSFTFDCQGTLIPKDKNGNCNRALYHAGKSVCSHETVPRQLFLASTDPKAPILTSELLDRDFKEGKARSKDAHSQALSPFKLAFWKQSKEIYELLADDKGIDTEYPGDYVSIATPTWDNRLITFPKPR